MGLGDGILLNSTKSSSYFCGIGSERILSQSSFRLFGRSMFCPRLSIPYFLTLRGMMPVRPADYEKRWKLAKCTLLRQKTLVAVLVNVASSFCSRCSVHQEMANLGSNYTSAGCKTHEICVCMCSLMQCTQHVELCNNSLIVTATNNLAESCLQSSYEKQRACLDVTAQ